MKTILYILCLFGMSFLVSSCYYDVEEQLYPDAFTCDTTSVTFALIINPLITSKCVGCHNSTTTSGSINLDGYDNVKTQADNGNLLGTVSHSAGFSAMPKNQPKIPDCQIKAIEIWINNGAQND